MPEIKENENHNSSGSMNPNQQQAHPVYESPKKGTILAFNTWTARKSAVPLCQVTSGGSRDLNKWALSKQDRDGEEVKVLLHWNHDVGKWCEFESVCDDTKKDIYFKSIEAGPDNELWAITHDNRLFRRVPSLTQMMDGIYLSRWEHVNTGDVELDSICIGDLQNVWGVAKSNYKMKKTLLLHLILDKSLSPLKGRLSDVPSYEWEKIVVDVKLKSIDCNSNGDMWGVSPLGKLYQRVCVSNKMDNGTFDKTALSTYEPEESFDLDEDFFLLPGETLDTSIWRLVDPFKHTIESDRKNTVEQVSIGSKSVWCVDNEGKVYLRNGTRMFRRVTSAFASKAFEKKVETPDNFVDLALKGSKTKVRMPYVLTPNQASKVFKDDNEEEVKDFIVSNLDVNDDDVCNGLTPSGRIWFRLRPQILTIITANSYKKIWDDRSTGAPEDLGIWRPIPLHGYCNLGDFAERSHLEYPLTHNFESPNSYVICAREDPDQYLDLGEEDKGFELSQRLLVQPTSYIPVWDDKYFLNSGKFGNVTIWNPLPPSNSYAALGCIATPENNLKKDTQPTNISYCVHKSILLSGNVFQSQSYSNGALWCTVGIEMNKMGNQISMWEIEGKDDQGISAGGFVSIPSFYKQRTEDIDIYVLNFSKSDWVSDN